MFRRRCTRYLVYLLGYRDEFASFEKEKLWDRRFPLLAFAFSPLSQPSQLLSGNLSGRVLAENGHNVVWWTSNFSHHFKEFRTNIGSDIERPC